jgi:hypothetical protein
LRGSKPSFLFKRKGGKMIDEIAKSNVPKFEASPNSKIIWDYFSKKYGRTIAPVGLAKACSIVSAGLNTLYAANIFVVAPTRQFKSITSTDASAFFKANACIQIGSDFTMHDIAEHYKNKLDKKCIVINDGTLLLTSKSKKTKDRLVNGLAELLSDKRYRYGDRLSEIVLKGRISVIMNMTAESYERYKNELLGSTFLERFTSLFYAMSKAEQREFIKEKKFRMKVLNKEKIKLYKRDTDMTGYMTQLEQIVETFSILSCKSLFGTDDQVKSLVAAHACLNGRKELVQDDIDFLLSLEPYYNNPFAPNEAKILKLYTQGKNQKEICVSLGQNPSKYQPYVSRVIRTGKMRGVIAD